MLVYWSDLEAYVNVADAELCSISHRYPFNYRVARRISCRVLRLSKVDASVNLMLT